MSTFQTLLTGLAIGGFLGGLGVHVVSGFSEGHPVLTGVLAALFPVVLALLAYGIKTAF